MIKVVCLLLVALCLASAKDHRDSILKDTELVFTLLVHRHGDRTPVTSSLEYSTDPEKLAELSAPYGYGQLTERGKQRGYELGGFIRDRYNELLSSEYNRSEIYIRSTDSTRAKMTVLAAMAAVYPPGPDSWSQDIHWTPVPYTTVPAKYDYNLAMVNCPTFLNVYLSLFTSQPASMQRFSGVLDELSAQLGFNLTAVPAVVYAVYDTYTAQISLGMPLPKKIQKIFPQVEEAAGQAIDVVFGNENYIALQAGVLLQQFYEYADKIQAGEDTQRVRIYSAHDYNVFSFLSVTQIEDALWVPKYGSAYALELRRLKRTGEYVVLPVYLPSPGDDVEYLKVEGCDVLCPFDQFVEITSKNALDEDTWRTKCGFTNDLVVDDEGIA